LLTVEGLFVAIGLIPQNEIFANVLKLNSYGYADSDESCVTETKGIFVAGDCREKKVRQMLTACADGAIAALAACEYCNLSVM
jgi:thioredoxin reductase (NADPH)